MDLALNLTTNCRVRVLLVPVSPIKKSTFYKYVELVKTFNMVRLGDVTPDLKKGSNGKNDNFCITCVTHLNFKRILKSHV